MGCSAGRSDRFFRMAECLIGKALSPVRKAQPRVASHAEVEADVSGAVALRNIKHEAFFPVLARCSEVTQIERQLAHHEMR
jgi:hypothetical protein